MFNPQKIARYFLRFFTWVLPVVGAALVLSWVAVSLHRGWSASLRFWLPLLAGMVPSLGALLATYLLAARFVQRFYGIETLTEARQVIHRSLFGQFSFGPWRKVAGGMVDEAEGNILTRMGGPGSLVIYSDSAVLLQRAGRFTRVEQTGFAPLRDFETVYQVVDLRPRRWVYPVTALSREGIPITCQADISYQIDNEGVPSTEQVPFPVSERRAFRAATCSWIREADLPPEDRVMDWSKRIIISETEGNLRTILARYPLDQLIGLADPSSTNHREVIRQELEQMLKGAAPKLAGRILGVELGNIEVQDEIIQQRIDIWRAEWERWAIEREAVGKAKQAELLEDAKTRAQVMLLATITEAFQPMLAQQEAVTSKLVLARLFMVLSRAPSDPLTRVNLPKAAIGTLQLLKDLIV
jgi:regulator of protease activity HflC (stomatin/prohibitin superfamily)